MSADHPALRGGAEAKAPGDQLWERNGFGKILTWPN